jgi:hypothetical protein
MRSENCTALIPAWESGIISNVLLQTCEVMRDYVNKIVILHCGSKDQMGIYDSFKSIPNVHVEWFDFQGNVEPALKHLSTFVPSGDWALFLDSDQRPCPLFLENLVSNLETLNKVNHNFGCVPVVHHEFKSCIFWKSGWPIKSSTLEDAIKNSEYLLNPLVRITDEFMVESNRGMHYGFGIHGKPYSYFPHPINHYKLYFEYFSSIFLTGYFDPMVHSRIAMPETIRKDEVNKEHYQAFVELKRKHAMPLSNDFNDKVYQKSVPEEFTEFFSNPQFSKNNNPETTHFLDNAYHFCVDYKFSLDESLNHTRFCGDTCCRYGDKQL